MRRVPAIFMILGCFFFLFAFSDDPIPNLYQARYMIFTSGQPSTEGFQQLAALGIRTVINVLPDEQCIREERGDVISNNMGYYRLPFDPSGINYETVRQFAWTLNSVEYPVLIHCSTGNHVGGVWFAYRVVFENASYPLAIQEARRIGMKPQMEAAVMQWLVDRGIRADARH